MKIKFLLSICAIALCFGFTSKIYNQGDEEKKPVIYINNFKVEVLDGVVLNCRKVNNIGVKVYFTDQMKSYDMFNVELHRFGDDGDVMAASKKYIPSSKEFQKNYADQESVKLNLLIQEGEFDKIDFDVNTLIYKMGTRMEHILCVYKEKQHCNFYVVVKGYNKNGKQNQFGEDLYDKGKEVSARSITFKNWESKTQ